MAHQQLWRRRGVVVVGIESLVEKHGLLGMADVRVRRMRKDQVKAVIVEVAEVRALEKIVTLGMMLGHRMAVDR